MLCIYFTHMGSSVLNISVHVRALHSQCLLNPNRLFMPYASLTWALHTSVKHRQTLYLLNLTHKGSVYSIYTHEHMILYFYTSQKQALHTLILYSYGLRAIHTTYFIRKWLFLLHTSYTRALHNQYFTKELNSLWENVSKINCESARVRGQLTCLEVKQKNKKKNCRLYVCSLSSPWRPHTEDKRMVLEYTHGLFIT